MAKPRCRSSIAWTDSSSFGSELPLSKIGLKLSEPTARTASSPAEPAATQPGRRPMSVPTRCESRCSGCLRQALDGQNTLEPRSEKTAGTRVSAATRVTATEMARAGPIARNMPRLDSSRARKATITAPAAEAMVSPTLPTASAMACLGSWPVRRCSR